MERRERQSYACQAMDRREKATAGMPMKQLKFKCVHTRIIILIKEQNLVYQLYVQLYTTNTNKLTFK